MAEITAGMLEYMAKRNAELREKLLAKDARMADLEDRLDALNTKAAEYLDRAIAAERQMMAMAEEQVARTGSISAAGIGLDGYSNEVSLVDAFSELGNLLYGKWLEDEEE